MDIIRCRPKRRLLFQSHQKERQYHTLRPQVWFSKEKGTPNKAAFSKQFGPNAWNSANSCRPQHRCERKQLKSGLFVQVLRKERQYDQIDGFIKFHEISIQEKLISKQIIYARGAKCDIGRILNWTWMQLIKDIVLRSWQSRRRN